MYQGVPCSIDNSTCCYNSEVWCPGFDDGLACDRYDRGAYPFGDLRIYDKQMSDYSALDPFPNAMFWNWAT